ncbi:hypothetical protein GDI0171 [Gluconacetobacter diazotrophicus PA1 5]|uniref:Uncharacterized protein n=1 Tax=Gluconacetobacter diazotrophicus (strain ATCC 49037 / DSM 5601 / CCUG 37298 / CIP 103539 / LMG 7603 / PAl5) TaxID=272568 RepID=A9H272_GLUDA|nr:hypothetical protein GDI0171 [Gluconacetobacter diazotrophicus PA1 5]
MTGGGAEGGRLGFFGTSLDGGVAPGGAACSGGGPGFSGWTHCVGVISLAQSMECVLPMRSGGTAAWGLAAGGILGGWVPWASERPGPASAAQQTIAASRTALFMTVPPGAGVLRLERPDDTGVARPARGNRRRGRGVRPA